MKILHSKVGGLWKAGAGRRRAGRRRAGVWGPCYDPGAKHDAHHGAARCIVLRQRGEGGGGDVRAARPAETFARGEVEGPISRVAPCGPGNVSLIRTAVWPLRFRPGAVPNRSPGPPIPLTFSSTRATAKTNKTRVEIVCPLLRLRRSAHKRRRRRRRRRRK